MTRQDERLILLKYLQRALDDPVGIQLEFLSEPDARYFRERLGQVRRTEEQYKGLAILDKGLHVWIAKRTEEPADGD